MEQQLPAFNLLPTPVISWEGMKPDMDSLYFCAGRLYVGSSDGQVYLYNVSKRSDYDVAAEPVGRKNLGYGKKSVSALKGIPALKRLLVLCDGNMTVRSCWCCLFCWFVCWGVAD